jgi:hypothetical protein
MAAQTEPLKQLMLEEATCAESCAWFLHHHGWIYDPAGEWLPFRLWPAQKRALASIQANRLIVALKARQLGMTWLVLGSALHQMLFRPGSTVLLFSRRDTEASDLLATRLWGMYHRLPAWLQARRVVTRNGHDLLLSNGSRAMAFPTTAGDSYAASMAVVDEADLCPDLGRLMRAVKPTTDAGGRMILLSRADKSSPQSAFKRIYQAARAGGSGWTPIFLPWSARPDRDARWYEAQKADVFSRTGSLDDLHEQYPSTDAEALAPRSLDKRIAPGWLHQCYQPAEPLRHLPAGAPAIPGLEVYAPPGIRRRYVVGVDTAEGNPTSDDSALTVLDRDSGEEAASLAGKLQPSALGHAAAQVALWFNRADVMVERNNHGHAVLLALREHPLIRRLNGHDRREGWLSSGKGKALLYDACADAFRNRETVLHGFAAFVQLASVEGNSLRAPDGEPDDRADSYALALAAISFTAASQGAPVAGGSRDTPAAGAVLPPPRYPWERQAPFPAR